MCASALVIGTRVAFLGQARVSWESLGSLCLTNSVCLTYAAIGPRFWKAEVIGDFPEAVARGFFGRELEQQASSSVRLDDQAWRKVFQVRWICVA